MKTKFFALAGLLVALAAGGAAWAFTGGNPVQADAAPVTQVTEAGCCVTGDCCCPGQGSCCDLSKRATADVAKTLKKAASCCSTGNCCCPGAGSCCGAPQDSASGEECCTSAKKAGCCSK